MSHTSLLGTFLVVIILYHQHLNTYVLDIVPEKKVMCLRCVLLDLLYHGLGGIRDCTIVRCNIYSKYWMYYGISSNPIALSWLYAG